MHVLLVLDPSEPIVELNAGARAPRRFGGMALRPDLGVDVHFSVYIDDGVPGFSEVRLVGRDRAVGPDTLKQLKLPETLSRALEETAVFVLLEENKQGDRVFHPGERKIAGLRTLNRQAGQRKQGPMTEDELRVVVEAYEAGAAQGQAVASVAEALGVSTRTATRRINEARRRGAL